LKIALKEIIINIQLQLVAGNATPEQIAEAVTRIKELIDQFNAKHSESPS